MNGMQTSSILSRARLRPSLAWRDTFFAGMSAAGETAAALLFLLPVTTRLGGAVAVAVAVGLSYSASMGFVNLGYAAHNGSFAVLGVLFLAPGGWMPRWTSLWARATALHRGR
jgi:hypothetical protein